MSILKPILAIHETPGMPNAIAAAIKQAHGKVCSVCGLESMGHRPESSWLGYARHDWDGIATDQAGLRRARELTTAAYRARNG